MSDVAASGGYYMAMACSRVVAEPLTLTGSIGVVTGKFNLKELYAKLGYTKENVSRWVGRRRRGQGAGAGGRRA
jgi:protease-4